MELTGTGDSNCREAGNLIDARHQFHTDLLMRMTSKKIKKIEKNSAPISAAANHEASSISCSSSDNFQKAFAKLDSRVLLLNTSHQHTTDSTKMIISVILHVSAGGLICSS